MGELTKRIVWVHINEIREIPITEQYSAYVKLKDFEEMRQEFPHYSVGYGEDKTKWIADILKWENKWLGELS